MMNTTKYISDITCDRSNKKNEDFLLLPNQKYQYISDHNMFLCNLHCPQLQYKATGNIIICEYSKTFESLGSALIKCKHECLKAIFGC